MMADLIRLAASFVAILALYGISRWLGLGGDVRIRDTDHARALADATVYGFAAQMVSVDRAGIGALLRDQAGRQMLVVRHGAMFVGRLLDGRVEARLDRNFLTIGTGEKLLPPVTLDLGEDAQVWASGIRHLRNA